MKKIILGLLAALTLAIPAARAQQIAGTWQGTLSDGEDSLRIVVKITDDDHRLKGAMYSIDEGADPMALSSISFQGGTLNFAIALLNARFSGKLGADSNSIAGQWSQGKPTPLTLVRANKDSAWEIPPPNAPMARDADPSFEVATIKPSKPGEEGSGYGLDGRHVTTENTSLNSLIGYAYDLHRKQIVAAPDWADSGKFDISGVPDKPGEPNDIQMKLMMQKLLADRFQLKFHREKRELNVYVLSVAKNGPKNLTISANAAEDSFSIPIGETRGGLKMTVWNGTMTNFAVFGLQGAVVDRPVVDRTGLTDRYDFALRWMPDDSQFGGHMQMQVKNPLPSLFTAMEEQLGLKLEPMKAPVDVLVIERAEKPSAN